MQKLQALTSYLRDPEILKNAGIQCNPERIDFWASSGTPDYLGETTPNGLYLFDHEYQGMIEMEDVAGDIRILIALVETWLTERDPDRDRLDDDKIRWKGEPVDDGLSDIAISLWFYEKTHFAAVAEENPAVPFLVYRGRKYALRPETFETAEELQNNDVTVTLEK